RDRGRDQGRRGAHPGDGARLRMAADRRTRGGGGSTCGGPRGTGDAAGGGRGDRRWRPTRPGADAGTGGAGERGDRGGAWDAGGVQYLADRYGGGDWADLRSSAPSAPHIGLEGPGRVGFESTFTCGARSRGDVRPRLSANPATAADRMSAQIAR